MSGALKSLQATRDSRSSSASRFTLVGPACLSSFAAKTGRHKPDGQPIWTRLTYAGETQIQRHVKIRRNANPFDPHWWPYFAERKFQKKFGITRQQAGIKPS